MSNNRFLQDFMRLQTKLVHEAEDQTQKKDKKGRTKSKHGTASGEPAFGEVTLALLISEKPGKKEVLDYFRNRIAKLVSEDMDMKV